MNQSSPVAPILLLNTTIATAFPAVFSLSAPISAEQARALVAGRETDSAIGHEATAAAMSAILGFTVPVNRSAGTQKPGQQALVLKLRGRLPEGVVLTREQLDAIGYDLLIMTRVDHSGPEAQAMALGEARRREAQTGLWFRDDEIHAFADGVATERLRIMRGDVGEDVDGVARLTPVDHEKEWSA